MQSDYFPIHAHSCYSVMDGMDDVEDHVQKVASLGQPGFALTDHGTMAGVVSGYEESKKLGLAFFPGCEFYLVKNVNDKDTRGTRYHIGMMALDLVGYKALLRLSSRSWQPERRYYKPLIDLSDLASLRADGSHEHIAVTTGCFSSMAVQAYMEFGDAKPVIQGLASWFPKTLYVELQDHGIDWTKDPANKIHDYVDDQKILLHLYGVATELGLPVVFGADSHYVFPAQQPTHDLMKDICYFGAGEDIHFSGGPYHLLTAKEVKKKVGSKVFAAVEEGHADLLDRNQLTIPPLDNYKFQVPKMYDQPDKELRKQTYQGLQAKGLATKKAYTTRVDYELDVIRELGMANYHLLIKTHVSDWCRDNDVIINTRGSANGSLVCYALGITSVDPLKWGTNFERYLSVKRKKPPDVDVDVDFQGRRDLINHLQQVFPTSVQIGTYSRIGFGTNKMHQVDEDAGSVVVQYMAAMRKKNVAGFDGKVLPQHRESLRELTETTVYSRLGTHAAGFILPGEGHSIADWLPLARVVSSDTVVTQMSKNDVEALGYTKIDILGLRALQTLNKTLALIGKPVNEWDWIPLNDSKATSLLRRGQTAGIFQYDGFTNRRGAMEMKIKTTKDCIIGIALYRPAMINGGQKDLYLANRGKPKDQQTRLHPLFDPIVADTAGVPLYQEQIMEMLQAVGMEFAEYNELMSAIKASNGFIDQAAETFQRLMPLFYDLCESKGIVDIEADHAWNSIIGFTEYGFNLAHSTSYGLMAYYAAYLKAHYPAEFMVSLLSVWSDNKDKTSEYIREARRLGFVIVKADVNQSDIGWTIDTSRPKSLRRGLLSVPGIGEQVAHTILAERNLNGPYVSIQDFIDRLPARPVTGGSKWRTQGQLVGICKILYEGNAFRSVGNK